MCKKLIIAAASARGFAQAAATCGYSVITLDAFADADTRLVAVQSFKIKMHESAQGFIVDEVDFKRVFSSISLDEVEGFLFGSLFDAAPDLLAWVAAQVRVLGNPPEVMRFTKSFEFFGLLDELSIRHPEVMLIEKTPQPSFSRTRESILNVSMGRDDEVNSANENWLSKHLGGSGGTHIQCASQGGSGDYSQRKIAGVPLSMLFVADGATAQLIGFNRQFTAPTTKMPYRFAGAVSGVALQPNIHAVFEHAAQQLTSALHLRGINSLDAILNDETLYILELNPRLSATFQLYPNLMHAHLQGCAGNLSALSEHKNACAHLVLYAENAVEIPADFVWPMDAMDIPSIEANASSVKIAQDAPICTVRVEAETADLAHKLVIENASQLKERFM
ncbi:MAG: ATP-grasp domain-containing protein [Methylotenera sp.]|nr:ATP-grasp domain-containing protein [Methylotenera sp.]